MEHHGSTLIFITCDELRKEFSKCPDDINKRILIIDIRNPALYNKSHLCLDNRNNNISAIRTKTRVMNIDPDLMKVCTVKNIVSVLGKEELEAFGNRSSATDVILIDNHTDNTSELVDPKSKVMRLINGLTKFDNQITHKITVPIKVLKGGYREWIAKYPHFNTDPTFDPDVEASNVNHPMKNITNHIHMNIVSKPVTPAPSTPTAPIEDEQTLSALEIHQIKPNIQKPTPQTPLSIIPTPLVTKPTPSRPIPFAPKPNIVKVAPGTAVPVNSILSIRSPLPRSHSSPNVNQADGDEISNLEDDLKDNLTSQFYDRAKIQNNNHRDSSGQLTTINNNHIVVKPRFDRTLKPAFNNEAINAIRAQLDFGRSPEASDKAKTGLHNLGNTCYMNSVVQCLAYTPSLVTYFSSDSYYNHINFNSQYGSKGELAIEFGALIEKLNTRRYRYIEPKSFQESIIKHLNFTRYEQQDSHEFMMKLFDKLHHDLNLHAKDKLFKQNGLSDTNGNNNDDNNINIPRATLGIQFWKKHLEMNKSIISDVFEGIFMSTLTCMFCRGQSNTFEVFNCLSLPIPPDVGRCYLRDCLDHFSNPERIAAWECPRCKQKREAVKKIVICKLPEILIIHLKRFSFDENGLRKKLQATVDFPLTDLSVDCTNVLPQSAYGRSSFRHVYSLYGVVNHEGSLDGGHYKAFCRLENHQWYTFNDSNVSDMRDTDVRRQEAYILFYSAGCQ